MGQIRKLAAVKSRCFNKEMLRKSNIVYSSKSQRMKQEMLERCKKIKESINAKSR